MRQIGPTIPRRRLGAQLASLRSDARMSQARIAEHLACSLSKIQKIEAGDVSLARGDLQLMLDAYGVGDPALRDELLDLQRQGKERGWWSAYGQLPVPLTTLLGLEAAAESMRVFEPLLVPEVLQTEGYAWAAVNAVDGPRWDGVPPERLVELTLERQARLLGDDGPRIEVILDEAVLRRPVGGPSVLAAQLDRLAAEAGRVSLRVVPFQVGGHPGLGGPLTLFDFGAAAHSPVGFVADHAGIHYVEKAPDVLRCASVFARIAEAALPPAASLRLLRDAHR